MALLDILRERAARKGGIARVDCGELGVLTVEALSPADCARLAGDSRALLYAACRELQSTGEALRSEGKVFRPDEIMAYITAPEADAAARTVLELSGMAGDGGALSELSGIRLQSVQAFEEGFSGIRPESVQEESPDSEAPAGSGSELLAGEEEIRLSSVQGSGHFVTKHGQVSREFLPADDGFTDESEAGKKAQILGDLSGEEAQIVGEEDEEAVKSAGRAAGSGEPLHETESESGADRLQYLHETKSDFESADGEALHEIESESPRRLRLRLHETESDFGGREGETLHETESESPLTVHEIRSELRQALHEIKSEVREMLHETESELAERAAEHLAEALRRAAEVR